MLFMLSLLFVCCCLLGALVTGFVYFLKQGVGRGGGLAEVAQRNRELTTEIARLMARLSELEGQQTEPHRAHTFKIQSPVVSTMPKQKPLRSDAAGVFKVRAQLTDDSGEAAGDGAHASGFRAGSGTEQRIQSLSRTLEQRLRELDTANEELRWLTKELQTARDYAISASQTKTHFLSNMSHEIRTPLNGLIATTELLLQTELNDEQREFVSISRESALVLLETVNDVLDFSRMESGKMSLDMVDFNIVALVEGAAELMSCKAREKNLSLMTYVSNEVPRSVCGDPARLRQVLINLLSNAIKFTDHGEIVCRVTLDSLTQARAVLRFAVYDTGIGMSSAMQKTLFEPFAQADCSSTRQHSGAGLGLSIARRLVELMSGSIGVDSTNGQGSTFWFTVPVEYRVAGNEDFTLASDALRNLHLLVVDGMPETQKIIQEYARSWGMLCSAVPTASEALALMGRRHANHKPFDVLIVDYAVPDMHPFTLARYTHNSVELSDVRLILLTAGEEEGRGARALKCGYSAFLNKPIKQSQLFDCIASIMKSVPPLSGVATLQMPDPSSAQTLKFSKDDVYRPTILVVEDNSMNQRIARLQLEDLGYRVHIANNGSEALDATSRLKYDLILMDCAMPIMDGYQATGCIRKQEALIGRRTPIIALTAHAMPGDRERCLSSGMDDYLSKPTSKDELGAAIIRWLGRGRADEVSTSPDMSASELF